MQMDKTQFFLVAFTALYIGVTEPSPIKHPKIIIVDEQTETISPALHGKKNLDSFIDNADKVSVADDTKTLKKHDILQPYLVPLSTDDSLVLDNEESDIEMESDSSEYYLVVLRKVKDQKKELQGNEKTMVDKDEHRQPYRTPYDEEKKVSIKKESLGTPKTLPSLNKFVLHDTKKSADKEVAQPEQGIWAWRGKKRSSAELDDDNKKELIRRFKGKHISSNRKNKNIIGKLPPKLFIKRSSLKRIDEDDLTSQYDSSLFINQKKRVDLKKKKEPLTKRNKIDIIKNNLDLEDADLVELLKQN